MSPITSSSSSRIDITAELHALKTTGEKVTKLENIFAQNPLTRQQLTTMKYQCTTLAKKESSEEWLQRIEVLKTQVKQRVDEQARAAKRHCRHSEVVPTSNDSTSVLEDSTSVLEVNLANTLSDSSRQVIEEMESALFSEICKCSERAGLDEVSTRWIIIQLENIFKTFNTNKESIAFRIGQLYEKIDDVSQATHYYRIASLAGCNRSFWRLATIAQKNEDFEGFITILKTRIPIPPEFYEKETEIKKLPTINERTGETIKIIKNLASAYYYGGNTVVATRLLDLAGNMGDSEIKNNLLNTVKEENKILIAQIEELNKGFRATILNFELAHMENPAKKKLLELASELLKKGYITLYSELFSELMVDIVANEALSSYLCAIHKRCERPTNCLATSLQLCESNRQLFPGHPLGAWLSAAIKSLQAAATSSSSETSPELIDRLAAIAQNGGFSDPRVMGANLYPATQSTTSLSSLCVFELEDDDQSLGGQ